MNKPDWKSCPVRGSILCLRDRDDRCHQSNYLLQSSAVKPSMPTTRARTPEHCPSFPVQLPGHLHPTLFASLDWTYLQNKQAPTVASCRHGASQLYFHRNSNSQMRASSSIPSPRQGSPQHSACVQTPLPQLNLTPPTTPTEPEATLLPLICNKPAHLHSYHSPLQLVMQQL